MIVETNLENLRKHLGPMLNRVQSHHDCIVINKDGKPVAALVDVRLFDRLRRVQDRFDALCLRIEAGFANMPETRGMFEIEAAVASERAQSRA